MPVQAAAGSSAEAAYGRLEALCSAVRAELAVDLRINDAAVLPSFVSLPQVTAAEYGRVRCIPCCPPCRVPAPSVALLCMVHAAGSHANHYYSIHATAVLRDLSTPGQDKGLIGLGAI